MTSHRIVSQSEWLEASRAQARQGEGVHGACARSSREERRALPWVKVEKEYVFEAPEGRVTPRRPVRRPRPAHRAAFHVRPGLERGLSELLLSGQTISTASTWHLAHRDTSFGARVARADRQARGLSSKRMGWSLCWVSSLNNDFNFDYGGFPSRRTKRGRNSDCRDADAVRPGDARPQRLPTRRGRRDLSDLFNLCPRGLDMLNGAYQLLRHHLEGAQDEKGLLLLTMAWVPPPRPGTHSLARGWERGSPEPLMGSGKPRKERLRRAALQAGTPRHPFHACLSS